MSGANRRNRSWWHRIVVRATCNMDDFGHGFYTEHTFQQKLVQERKRAERAGKPLMIMIISAGDATGLGGTALISKLSSGLKCCLRDTDICGALNEESVGVILTEITAEKIKEAESTVTQKVREVLKAQLGDELTRRITITFRVYPETGGDGSAFDIIFFPETTAKNISKTTGMLVNRVIDVFGSLVALLLLSPLFLLLPIAIKVTSKGPVLFIQERYGINGTRFNLLKFRSMQVDNDDEIHRQFVKQLIDGTLTGDGTTVFKITSDPRITRVGRILRAYSLDELPQLLNVLKGDMSLVGPRPPIQYEVENYSGWQRNRLIGKKPGITGVWQVSGRSTTTFDEMVRVDIRYLRKWSILLDIKIILLTPLAVLRCRGAY